MVEIRSPLTPHGVCTIHCPAVAMFTRVSVYLRHELKSTHCDTFGPVTIAGYRCGVMDGSAGVGAEKKVSHVKEGSLQNEDPPPMNRILPKTLVTLACIGRVT